MEGRDLWQLCQSGSRLDPMPVMRPVVIRSKRCRVYYHLCYISMVCYQRSPKMEIAEILLLFSSDFLLDKKRVANSGS